MNERALRKISRRKMVQTASVDRELQRFGVRSLMKVVKEVGFVVKTRWVKGVNDV